MGQTNWETVVFLGYPKICSGPSAAHRGPYMSFEQYHEPANELPEKTRTFARMIVSMIGEAETINWNQQRIAVEKDRAAKAIMRNAQH